MSGRLVGGFLVLIALIAGAAVYYLQVYAFYEDASAVSGGDVMLTKIVSGDPEPILAEGLTAIDADSSPIRYRGCFQTSQSLALLTETYVLYEETPDPRVAPGWFDCFDADDIAAQIDSGEMLVFLGQANIQYGIDRVIGISATGQGRIWHEINACGSAHFDGDPLPDDCPTPPAE